MTQSFVVITIFTFCNFSLFVNDQDKNKDQSNSGINHGNNKSSPQSQEEGKEKRKKSIRIRSKSSGRILEEIKEIIDGEKTRKLVLDYCNQTSPVSFRKEFSSSLVSFLSLR